MPDRDEGHKLIPMTVGDRLTKYQLQRLGMYKDEIIILTLEEQERLAAINTRLEEEYKLKGTMRELFDEIPNISREQAREVLLSHGLVKGELLESLDGIYFGVRDERRPLPPAAMDGNRS